eukprot:snap_masked-scaffold_70-processed-gene-0.2-mRNA-1 protein AED:1.00 eAED:1.00 QI:0/0/0/0/1/1/2/0/166
MFLPQRSCLTSTSTEGLECASQREQRLLVVSVNVGGLTTTKLNLLGEKTQQLSVLMLQELHELGYKMLMEKVKVSSSKGKWFFSKPPTGAAGVATYLAEELACNVSTVESNSDRILKVVLQGTCMKKMKREGYTQVSRTALKGEEKLGFKAQDQEHRPRITIRSKY